MDELLADFLAETAEGLVELDAALLKLERAPEDGGTLAVAFRIVHTIKGTCGFLALPRLERVAHAGEDLLAAMRDGVRIVTPELISTVLAAVDRMRTIVAAIQKDGAEPAGTDAELLGLLGAALARRAQDDAASPLLVTGEDLLDGGAAQTIRVNVASLEALMTLVSELVLTRNQLLQVARSDGDSRFNAPLQRLSNLTSDLQEGVMKTRMQPIRHAWNTFPRLVRDLAAELGKPITLDMRGEDTELDRHVLELIRGPLTHMVRNCADHGLERTEARLAAGKPACGTITLNSYHEGGTVVIEVRDDGAGLATERIKERALRKQLIAAPELAGWTEQQVNRLIFLPGFTTTDAVTAFSGRGVGMDVVLTNIERLGGTVDVDSVTGAGTVFTVRIPLTLAIISALVVDAGGQRFALPQTCVAELVRVEAQRTAGSTEIAIERVDGTPMLRLRNKLLPLVSLARLLNLPPPPDDDGPSTVVVAQLGGLRAGLMVDEVFDTEEIVVKPVSRRLRHIPVFSGNTILGDGSVIMILDPSGLSHAIGPVSAVRRHQGAEETHTAAEHSGDKAAMLLIRLAAGAGPVAVPLGLVARIESIARDTMQRTPDRLLTLYRNRIMPLVEPAGALPDGPMLSVLVFSDRGRSVGLVVAEIVDVVEDHLAIELTSRRPGLLGTASIAGQVTDVLDTGYWLKQGQEDWFAEDGAAADGPGKRVLVVEDSAFFRQLLVPALAASGYHVTAVDSAAKALAMRDAAESASFDAIISDVEMPGIDGLQFARRLRQGGQWSTTPLLALSGRCDASDVGRGTEAGFDEFVGKFDRGWPACRPATPHPAIRAARSMTPGTASVAGPAGAEGAFVTLSLAGQLCGLPVASVRDVLRQQSIAPVALSAPEIAGNLNLRGHIVTAIDLRRRLKLPPAPPGTASYAVVTEEAGEMYALLADRICDVISPDPLTFEAVPPTLPANWARYSAGLFRLEDGLMIVLDVPRLLALSGEAP